MYSDTGDIVGLELHGANVDDEDLEGVACLKHLAWLNLSRTPITDAGLRRLGAVTSLQSLKIDYTAITDGGVRHLRGLDQLTTLSISGTAVTDRALDDLATLGLLDWVLAHDTAITQEAIPRRAGPRGGSIKVSVGRRKVDVPSASPALVKVMALESPADIERNAQGKIVRLRIHMHMDVCDDDFVGIERLHCLRELIIDDAPVLSDEAFKHIGKASSLEVLKMGGAAITSEGLAYLVGLRKLQSLFLQGDGIDDDGMKYIAMLGELRAVVFRETKVSTDGEAVLKGHLKKLEVVVRE